MKITITERVSFARERPLSAAFLLVLLLFYVLMLLCLVEQAAYGLEGELTTKQPLCDARQATGEGDEASDYGVQDIIDARTNQSDSAIPDAEVPLGAFSELEQTGTREKGSIFNTAAALFCMATMFLMLVTLSKTKTRDYRVITLRTIAVSFGLVTVVAWSLLDRLQVPSLGFNAASLLIALLLTVYVGAAIASYLYEAKLQRAEDS